MNSKEALRRIEEELYLILPKNIRQELIEAIKKDLVRLEKLERQLKDGTLSDGYHTFNDLYLQRMYLFATIVNQNKSLAWKSFKHEDGELCFGGDWFIVGIDTPKGSYTYHYETNYWSLFNCKELEVGKKWDGHTSKDVDRLLSLHFNAFDQLEKQVITLIEEKKLYEKQIKNWSEKYETVEKELLKTKNDFKYSQTSSKNCYKKLKEKYNELQFDYNDLQKDYGVLDVEYLNLEKENAKLKQAIEVLKGKAEVLEFGLDKYEWCEETNDYRFKYNFEEVDYEGQVHYTVTIFALTKEEYELLKKVFESVGGDDE